MKIQSENIHQLLFDCFRILAAKSPMVGTIAVSTHSGIRLSVQIDKALASRIVGLIDRHPDSFIRALYYYAYSRGGQAQALPVIIAALGEWLDDRLDQDDQEKRERFSRVIVFAPEDYRQQCIECDIRARITANATLATCIGVKPRWFRRAYAKIWRDMVCSLHKARAQMDDEILNLVEILLEAREEKMAVQRNKAKKLAIAS